MANNLRPNLTSVLSKHTGKLVNNFGVATPGIVTKVYNNLGGRTFAIDVQPAVHRMLPTADDEDVDVYEEHAVQRYVSVMWLVGRGIQVNAKLEVGDTVLLVCMDRGINRWRASGAPSLPDDARQHDWSSCAAIPGLVPDTSPFPEPGDAAALASMLDKLVAVIKAWVPASGDGGAALKAAVTTAFPAIVGDVSPALVATSTGSTVLLLEE